MEWINTKDRLPEHFKWVLVWWPSGGDDDTSVSIGWRCPGFDPKGSSEIWDVAGATCGYEKYQDQITHWMPLPDSPTN